MAKNGDIQLFPPLVPSGVIDSWQLLVKGSLLAFRGLNRVSIGEYANTNAPYITAGSMIEIEGNIIVYDSNAVVIPPSSSGTYYVICESGVDNLLLTANKPVWNASKGGFYDGPHRRYTGHIVHFDGGSTYEKASIFYTTNAFTGCFFVESAGDVYSECFSFTPQHESIYGEWTIPLDTSMVIPFGIYVVALESGKEFNLRLQMKDQSGNWVAPTGDIPVGYNGFIISDGSNYRFSAVNAQEGVVAYRRVF